MKYLKIFESRNINNYNDIINIIKNYMQLSEILKPLAIQKYKELCNEENYEPDQGDTPSNKSEEYLKELFIKDYDFYPNDHILEIVLSFIDRHENYENYYIEIEEEEINIYISSNKFGI